jgi:ABC-type transport system involved in cytochrome bd biosynthesis fused ATPase/permease subunit
VSQLRPVAAICEISLSGLSNRLKRLLIQRFRSNDGNPIVGPSGLGKTSLLRLLNRLDEPTSGTVFLSGADYRQLVTRDLRRRVGMVTQRPYLFSGTVAENLRLRPRQRGEELPGDQIDELLSGVSLVGYAARNVATLSVEKHSESRLHAYWLTRPRYCCSMSRRRRWMLRPRRRSKA